MISGRIVTHTEPEKYNYKATHTTPSWMSDWEDYTGMGGSESLWAEKDAALLKLVNEGTLKGLVIGARVKRANNFNDSLGTITHIHRSHAMAWNYTSKQVEPFKVVWDRTALYTGGTYDYKPDDLVVVEVPKHLPALLEQTKGDNNETLLHLC